APQGFLARLFKIREQTVNLDVEEPVSEHPKDLVEKHTETLSSTIDTVEDEQLSSLQPLEKNIVASTEDNDLFSLPQMLEPTYSSVAQHIHDTLISLMNDLPFTSQHEQQVLELRSRIDGGLNWYELAPLLDELSIIILDIANGGKNELEQYLLQL